MSKLMDDPKVAALVEKQAAAAVKAETKRVLSIVKDATAGAKELEDKTAKTAVVEALKSVMADIKIAA